MTKTILKPQPLTREAFAPFGDVIDTSGKPPLLINSGTTERYDNLAKIQCYGQGIISIFRAQPRSLPMRIRMLERHPKGSQSFHPLSGEPYLVLVADPAGDLQAKHLHLFLAGAQQGVNYHAQTWHHPLLALNKVCDFLVIDRKTNEPNCEEYCLDESINIEINYTPPPDLRVL